MQRDASLLLDMVQAARRIVEFVRGVDLQEVYRAANVEVPKLLAFLESRVPPQDASDPPSE